MTRPQLGNFYSGLIGQDELSPEAQGFVSPKAKLMEAQTQKAKAQAAKARGDQLGAIGRSRAAEKAAGDFESSKQGLIQAIRSGDLRNAKILRRKMEDSYGKLSRHSDFLEFGVDESGQWPWVKVKTPQGSRGLIQQPQSAPGAIPPLPQVTAPQSLNLGQPQTPRTATMDDVRKVAKQMNWTDQQVIDHFKSKGVQITQ